MKISKKWNKWLEISSIYISATKLVIICYTVPEIRWVTDVIAIFHFGLFFALLPLKAPGYIIILHNCTKNYDYKLYCTWDMARDICNCFFFFGLFFPLLPPNSQKKWKFQKNLKMHGDTSFYTIVPKIMTIGYTVPEIWCVTDVIVVSFWAIFCPFTP